VLPLDAILMRLSLGVLVGLLVSLLTSIFWALVIGVAAFYLLLVIARKPIQTWPPR